ncbi:uncharacterized protein F4812DRAFT_465508 [Daldinia caldariorum]|uniref:uncharacterized protein n=1 Tax=Daldinia caldariorum TaxID=326644 RepID=UPI002008CC9C|nr:uncharacterized protein F4812DRAFT_465508 [Daldinia caldariorum]KAI1466862.1 hypothetical protein F4812DRAFT_465508 [Daldinia caldariorum]
MPVRSKRRTTRHLPAEILLLIFSHFIPHDIDPVGLAKKRDGPLTLAALARCSKWFYRIATPILYSTIYVHRTSSCDALIRTFSRQLDLRRLTHSLTVIFSDFGKYPAHYPNIAKKVIRDPARKFNLPPRLRQRIISKRKYYSLDSQVAFLLSFLPNLKELLLVLPSVLKGVVDILEYITRNRNTSSEPHEPVIAPDEESSIIQLLPRGHFAKLQTVRICSYGIVPPDQYRNLGERLVSAILRLPQITTFSLKRVGILSSQLKLDNIPKTLGLQHLELDSNRKDGQVLVDLLSQCLRLRSFKLIIHYDGPYGWRDPVPLGAVGNILRRNLTDSLETLTIKIFSSFYSGIIGPLRGLKKLRTLWIPLELVVGSVDSWDLNQCLPDSLEFIYFGVADTKTDNGRLGRLGHLHNEVVRIILMETRPNLRRVRVDPVCSAWKTHGPVDYARNIERPGWNVAWMESKLGLGNLVDPWPEMLEVADAHRRESAFTERRFLLKHGYI